MKGYSKKLGDTRTMRKLLHNSERFEYHASPRMVPHVFKPEIMCVKLTIEKYIPCLKKRKVTVSGASPILSKVSEEDGQLLTRYFGAHGEDTCRPSLVAFPRFQLSPSIVHKVPHSFCTTNMLIDGMQQLRDVSFSRTKNESPFQEPTLSQSESSFLEPVDLTALKGQAHEGMGLNSINGNKEAMPQKCDGLEASSRETVSVPGSLIKVYPIHSFFCSDYVTVDRGGNVSVTFVPVLLHMSACHNDTKNASWCHTAQKIAVSYKSTANFSNPTVELECPAYVTDSGKHMLENSISNLARDSRQCVDETVITTPTKTLTSPRDKWDTPCNARLASSAFSSREDTELSPRLTHYMEQGMIPESPVLNVNHLEEQESPVLDVNHLEELGGAVNVGLGPKILSSQPLGEGMQAEAAWCQEEPLRHEKSYEWLYGITQQTVLNQTQSQAEELACPSNVKICTPTTHTATNLCDSFSTDCQLKSGGDSGSVQQAPKYRRLCKYGDKIKQVSISLDDCHDGFRGNKGKGKSKRCLDTYIDEQVEVSQDAVVSDDEDDDLSEDKYEDSFIDDQETPRGEFTRSEQDDGNNGDMMGFYRQSLLTQTPVVLPSRYLDASHGSASSRTRTTSSSETGHSSVEKVERHHIMGPSPLCYQQRSVGGADIMQQQSETIIGNCESSSKMDCRKRKLNFQQPSSIPVINLELEPAHQPLSHLAAGANDDAFLDDDFFEGLDLDAIEAQATEQWKQRTGQSTHKPVEPKKASDISFDPPSFDLGF